ncbi:MAG: hypothetical protein HOW73_47225 [Polyangiaceae bacterium]|nr:hypothetical protein [Polyangiaceae bacterium]
MAPLRRSLALIVLAAAGCSAPPPAPAAARPRIPPPDPAMAPPPPEDGSEQGPYLVSEHARMISVRASVETSTAFRIDARSDLAFSFEGKGPNIKDPRGLVIVCSTSPCIIPSAPPGPYRLLPADSDAQSPQDAGMSSVDARVLAPVERTALDPKKGKVVLTPKQRPSDPRGSVAEATLSVAAPGAAMTLKIKPRLAKTSPTRPTEAHELYRALGFQVLGSAAGLHATFSEHETEPNTFRYTFTAAPGDYVLRVAPRSPDVHVESVEVRVEKAEPKAREDGGRTTHPPAPSGASLPVLAAGDRRTFDVAAPPAPLETWIRVEGARDVAWTWTDPELEVHMRGSSWLACLEQPCVGRMGVTMAADGSMPTYAQTALATSPVDATRPVEVRIETLPEASTAAVLQLGKVVTATTAPVRDKDPRGPLADFAFDAPEAGTYKFAVRGEGDFNSLSMEEAAQKLPSIRIFDALGGELLFSESAADVDAGDRADPRKGVLFERFMVDVPGRYIVRIDGRRMAPPRKVEVYVQRT